MTFRGMRSTTRGSDFIPISEGRGVRKNGFSTTTTRSSNFLPISEGRGARNLDRLSTQIRRGGQFGGRIWAPLLVPVSPGCTTRGRYCCRGSCECRGFCQCELGVKNKILGLGVKKGRKARGR
jgi:hypothetical protein